MKRLASVAAAASVFLLAGCVSTVTVPTGLPDKQIAEMTKASLDATWAATGLTDRPHAALGELESGASFFDSMRECMYASGISLDGLSRDQSGGYTPLLVNNVPAGPADRVAFYLCFAEHPIDPVSGTGVATREQLEYLYDYWQRWLIPCIALHGYDVTDPPRRIIFVTREQYSWSPYGAVTSYRSAEEFEALVAECGPEYGALIGP